MGKAHLATAAQLKALLSSYAEEDRSRFLSVASQIAAKAARDGEQALADQLLELVAAAKRGADRVPFRSHARSENSRGSSLLTTR